MKKFLVVCEGCGSGYIFPYEFPNIPPLICKKCGCEIWGFVESSCEVIK